MGLCTSNKLQAPLNCNVFTKLYKEANFYPLYQLYSIYFEICMSNRSAFHLGGFYCANPTVALASVASRALFLDLLSVRSLSDLSKDLSQPRWILIEARVTQILWGPLVEVVVQHRSCEQENIWEDFNTQYTYTYRKYTCLSLKMLRVWLSLSPKHKND